MTQAHFFDQPNPPPVEEPVPTPGRDLPDPEVPNPDELPPEVDEPGEDLPGVDEPPGDLPDQAPPGVDLPGEGGGDVELPPPEPAELVRLAQRQAYQHALFRRNRRQLARLALPLERRLGRWSLVRRSLPVRQTLTVQRPRSQAQGVGYGLAAFAANGCAFETARSLAPLVFSGGERLSELLDKATIEPRQVGPRVTHRRFNPGVAHKARHPQQVGQRLIRLGARVVPQAVDTLCARTLPPRGRTSPRPCATP